jgi:hypothetical protein
VRWLVSANYDFVTLDHKDLFWILQQNAMQMNEEVTHMFARLQGPECDEASAILVLADLIKTVWLEPLTDDQKWLILDLALRTLTAGRVSQRVITKLAPILKNKFIFLPLHWSVVLRDMNLWCQQKLL